MSMLKNTKDEALQKISILIKRFKEHKDEYRKSDYNETLVRRDFIDPFFKALNWDIENECNKTQTLRDVYHEDRVSVNENKKKKTKSPDYSFRVFGKRIFFVEAKKPSVFIKEDIEPAYQLRRYAWSAKLKVSILTDFEEFAIYDCTKKTPRKRQGNIRTH